MYLFVENNYFTPVYNMYSFALTTLWSDFDFISCVLHFLIRLHTLDPIQPLFLCIGEGCCIMIHDRV